MGGFGQRYPCFLSHLYRFNGVITVYTEALPDFHYQFFCLIIILSRKCVISLGATTGTVLAMRSGASMALKSGLFGGLILAMIEGLSIAMNRQSAPPPGAIGGGYLFTAIRTFE